MFNKFKNIDDVNSCLRVNEECVIYYSSEYLLKLLDSGNLAVKFEHQFTRDFDCKVLKGNLFVSVDNDLLVLDVENLKWEKACQANGQYITALSDHRFLASSYRRKDKEYDNSIYDRDCNLLWEINGEMSFRDVYQSHLLLSDRRGNKIGYLNFKDCNLLWQRGLDSSINGESIETEKYIIIPLSVGLFAFDRQSGEKVWSIDNSLSHYSYDEQKDSLYGLISKSFEVVDVSTGNREVKKEFGEDLHIASHLTYYSNDLLYFSGYRDNNIPIFGAINVKNGNLVFTQEVEMPGEKSFRRGLDRPIIVGNRLYVRDAMKTLHVYEREDHPA